MRPGLLRCWLVVKARLKLPRARAWISRPREFRSPPHVVLPRPLSPPPIPLRFPRVSVPPGSGSPTLNPALPVLTYCSWSGLKHQVHLIGSGGSGGAATVDAANVEGVGGSGWSVTGMRVLSGGHTRSDFSGLFFLFPFLGMVECYWLRSRYWYLV